MDHLVFGWSFTKKEAFIYRVPKRRCLPIGAVFNSPTPMPHGLGPPSYQVLWTFKIIAHEMYSPGPRTDTPVLCERLEIIQKKRVAVEWVWYQADEEPSCRYPWQKSTILLRQFQPLSQEPIGVIFRDYSGIL